MKNITLAFWVIWASFALNLAKAQTIGGKITGQVLDADHQPAVAATIVLVNAKDSTTVKTVLADAKGRFLLEPPQPGDYRVWITMMGFQKYRSEVINLTAAASVHALEPITLKPAGTALQSVAITAQKQFVEQKIDRMVVNVGASISNTGANALEVLEKTPGVVVDQNGKITFKGKSGVMVMIDDKPTYLSGDNLANYLRSLPASQLDQIELMTNPPAKYDASGNAGVINIKTKKSKAMGFNGSVAVSAGKAMYWRTNESLTLNYHINKINLFMNAGYNLYNNYRRLDVGRYYLDAAGNQTSSYNEVAFFHPLNQSPNVKLGMDYYISPKTTIGFVFTGSMMRGDISNPVYSTLRNGAGMWIVLFWPTITPTTSLKTAAST